MPLNRYPDAVSADLAAYEREQDWLEKSHEASKHYLEGQALYDCMDAAQLKEHLNDGLHRELAELFRAYETGGDCMREILLLRNRVVEIIINE